MREMLFVGNKNETALEVDFARKLPVTSAVVLLGNRSKCRAGKRSSYACKLSVVGYIETICLKGEPYTFPDTKRPFDTRVDIVGSGGVQIEGSCSCNISEVVASVAIRRDEGTAVDIRNAAGGCRCDSTPVAAVDADLPMKGRVIARITSTLAYRKAAGAGRCPGNRHRYATGISRDPGDLPLPHHRGTAAK